MCSNLITNLNSCYLDNFGLIANVFAKSFILGTVIGTVVGVLILFVKNLRD